ncbi:unnamed protein product [Polarella glacialis]|uniref:Bestrophin homolog n=2 Tax=Polarella glacialis TaxID=89957 RepID=A0A813K3Y2_POLGL|nr:unnamed protein product [Polarella glacialis]
MGSQLFSWHDASYMEGVDSVWAGYTFVLGFLIVFRNNQAYNRFWEGTSLATQFKGHWFITVSNLCAFCSRSTANKKKAEVAHFQNALMRLFSLLHCAALQEICDLKDDSLEIINSDQMDEKCMIFLKDAINPCEVIVNWIQRLVIQANDSCVIDVPAPILSRVFQELGSGSVSFSNAKKLRDVPFPFPYAQLISCMLFVHWLFTPVFAAYAIESSEWAGVMSFFVTMSFWSLYYIALEIDQPFGEDPNDLPIHKIQQDWNNSLLTLLLPCSKVVPTFEMSADKYESSLFPTDLDELIMAQPADEILFKTYSRGRSSQGSDFREQVIVRSPSKSPSGSRHRSNDVSFNDILSESSSEKGDLQFRSERQRSVDSCSSVTAVNMQFRSSSDEDDPTGSKPTVTLSNDQPPPSELKLEPDNNNSNNHSNNSNNHSNNNNNSSNNNHNNTAASEEQSLAGGSETSPHRGLGPPNHPSSSSSSPPLTITTTRTTIPDRAIVQTHRYSPRRESSEAPRPIPDDNNHKLQMFQGAMLSHQFKGAQLV